MNETSFGAWLYKLNYIILFVIILYNSNTAHCGTSKGIILNSKHGRNSNNDRMIKNHIITEEKLNINSTKKKNQINQKNASRMRDKRRADSPFSNTFPINQQEHLFPNSLPLNHPQASLNPDMRQRLVNALEQRIRERNMLLHDTNLMREKEYLQEKALLQGHDSILDPNLMASRKSTIYNNNGLFSRPSANTESLLLANQLDSQLHSSSGLLNSNPMSNPMSYSSLLAGDEASLLSTHHNGLLGSEVSDDTSLLPRDSMFQPAMGSLGDETLPYGSLGEIRSGYIPLGRVGTEDQVNQ